MARKNKRESKASRRMRERTQRRLLRGIGVSVDGVNHERIDCDSLEFACLFTVENGRKKIGDGSKVYAFDSRGKRPGVKFGGESGVAIAPSMLDIERDKATKLMAAAADARARLEARQQLREEKLAKQSNQLVLATDRHATGWFRQEVSDQRQRTVLLGTHNGVSPVDGSQGILVSFKSNADGRHYIAREFWSGGWSDPDEYGNREREGVTLDFACHDDKSAFAFHSKSEAEQAVLFAIDEGAKIQFASGANLNFSEIRNLDRFRRKADKLQTWKKDGTDMKRAYGTKRPAPEPKRDPGGKSVRIQ